MFDQTGRLTQNRYSHDPSRFAIVTENNNNTVNVFTSFDSTFRSAKNGIFNNTTPAQITTVE